MTLIWPSRSFQVCLALLAIWSKPLEPTSARRFRLAPSMLTYDRPTRIWTGVSGSNCR
ncbi:hypothetical protein [Nonomuraea solani]|uniref:hypothetical protein n=1 Tax=Nonomuraea solani TaxID=1144553 RepID=UPI001F3C986E|nr:hypothetical protein [Nonomuraea solani]